MVTGLFMYFNKTSAASGAAEVIIRQEAERLFQDARRNPGASYLATDILEDVNDLNKMHVGKIYVKNAIYNEALVNEQKYNKYSKAFISRDRSSILSVCVETNVYQCVINVDGKPKYYMDVEYEKGIPVFGCFGQYDEEFVKALEAAKNSATAVLVYNSGEDLLLENNMLISEGCCGYDRPINNKDFINEVKNRYIQQWKETDIQTPTYESIMFKSSLIEDERFMEEWMEKEINKKKEVY